MSESRGALLDYFLVSHQNRHNNALHKESAAAHGRRIYLHQLDNFQDVSDCFPWDNVTSWCKAWVRRFSWLWCKNVTSKTSLFGCINSLFVWQLCLRQRFEVLKVNRLWWPTVTKYCSLCVNTFALGISCSYNYMFRNNLFLHLNYPIPSTDLIQRVNKYIIYYVLTAVAILLSRYGCNMIAIIWSGSC